MQRPGPARGNRETMGSSPLEERKTGGWRCLSYHKPAVDEARMISTSTMYRRRRRLRTMARSPATSVSRDSPPDWRRVVTGAAQMGTARSPKTNARDDRAGDIREGAHRRTCSGGCRWSCGHSLFLFGHLTRAFASRPLPCVISYHVQLYLGRSANKTPTFVYVEKSSLPSLNNGSGCDSRQQCDDLEKTYSDTLIFKAAIERQTRGSKRCRAEAEPCGKNSPNWRILAKIWGPHRGFRSHFSHPGARTTGSSWTGLVRAKRIAHCGDRTHDLPIAMAVKLLRVGCSTNGAQRASR